MASYPPSPYSVVAPPPARPQRGRPVIAIGIVAVGLLVLGGLSQLGGKRHHVAALPPAFGDVTRDPQSAVAASQVSLDTVNRAGARNVQVGVYDLATGARVFVLVGELPVKGDASGGFFDGLQGTGVVNGWAPMPSDGHGGQVRCGASATDALCAWADDGTFGMVLQASTDTAGASLTLAELRQAVEH